MIRLAKKLLETLALKELENATTAPQASAKIALMRYVVNVVPLVKILLKKFIVKFLSGCL